MITHQRTHFRLGREKLFSVSIVVVLLIALLSGCAAPANEPSEAVTDQPSGDPEVALYVERFTTPQDADMDHFVGAVDDQLFVGVAVSSRDASEEGTRRIAVYLCDSQDVSRWIFGEIAGKEATLDDGDLSVDVAIYDESVSGTVALGEQEPQPFTADLVTSRGGLYRATYTLGGVDYHLDWVVLPDGRARGPLDGKGNDIPPPPPPLLQ